MQSTQNATSFHSKFCSLWQMKQQRHSRGIPKWKLGVRDVLNLGLAVFPTNGYVSCMPTGKHVSSGGKTGPEHCGAIKFSWDVLLPISSIRRLLLCLEPGIRSLLSWGYTPKCSSDSLKPALQRKPGVRGIVLQQFHKERACARGCKSVPPPARMHLGISTNFEPVAQHSLVRWYTGYLQLTNGPKKSVSW